MSCFPGDFEGAKKAFSPKRGLIFTVNGASAPPPPPPPQIPRTHPWPSPPPSPPFLLEDPPGIFSKTPTAPQEKEGVGGEGPGVGGGGAEAPFTAKTSPLFGENALKPLENYEK